MQRFCADIKPGSGHVNACLEKHAKEVSPGCQAKLEDDTKTAKAIIAEFFGACGSDAERVCGNVQHGEGRLLKCLSRNDYALSPQCLAQVNRLETARQKVKALEGKCQPDVERLCPSATHAGELLACLEANRAELSASCKSADPAIASEAATLVDTVDEMTSEARIQDTVAILQGLNTVAFSRNQIAFSFDYFESLANKPANVDVLTFSPLFVFGPNNEFAVQFKVPVAAVFPYADAPAATGVGDINTAFGWAFYARGSIRQYAAVALQWNSATEASVGAPWLVSPVYAIAVGLASWVSLTTEVSWVKSFGPLDHYPGVNLLSLRPILVFNLPSTTFIAIDTKLGWDFLHEIFVPVMRFQGGKLIGRDHDLSISAWYQLSLNTVSRGDSFDFGVGMAFSYFFDW